MSSARIQELIHALEEGRGSRWLKYLPLVVAVLGLLAVYDLRSFRGFSSVEAMDAAQVARNLAAGNGFSTDFIRPFSLYLVQAHNEEVHAGELAPTNHFDFAELKGHHPDLANAPLYPTLLAGLIKTTNPDWETATNGTFWAQNGHFRRYSPEFLIAILNQLLFIGVVGLTFLIARKLFDAEVAWLSAFVMLGLDAMWRFSISGQSTMLLLLIFLGLVWCIASIEEAAREATPSARRLLWLAAVAGLVTGLGMLTRYAFGWMIVPVFVFLILFGGIRRPTLAVTAFVTFGLVVAPWIIRNLTVSGTLFGTAGYAIAEGTSAFPGSKLMQSMHPDLTALSWLRICLHKLFENGTSIFQNDLLHLGGGWMAILFFAGLLLGLRSPAARRLRYFTLMSLGILIVVQALGETSLSTLSPEINSENLLVLLTPLVVIFGIVFFLTLLNQMKVPSIEVRFAVMVLLVLVSSLSLAGTVFSRTSPIAYPPYYPPEIQKAAGWLDPDELMMSDIPWAVAWYGNRQCTWTTTDTQKEFYAINDYIKPVNGLYLSLNALNPQLFTECLKGGKDSWGYFVFMTLARNQVPKGFPLRHRDDSLLSGLFLTDHQRWQ